MVTYLFQIHLILTLLRTYGASLTKLNTEIRSLRPKSRLRLAWRNIQLSSLSVLARSMPQRLKNVIQKNEGTLDIDILTVDKGNNVHKTKKL